MRQRRKCKPSAWPGPPLLSYMHTHLNVSAIFTCFVREAVQPPAIVITILDAVRVLQSAKYGWFPYPVCTCKYDVVARGHNFPYSGKARDKNKKRYSRHGDANLVQITSSWACSERRDWRLRWAQDGNSSAAMMLYVALSLLLSKFIFRAGSLHA